MQIEVEIRSSQSPPSSPPQQQSSTIRPPPATFPQARVPRNGPVSAERLVQMYDDLHTVTKSYANRVSQDSKKFPSAYVGIMTRVIPVYNMNALTIEDYERLTAWLKEDVEIYRKYPIPTADNLAHIKLSDEVRDRSLSMRWFLKHCKEHFEHLDV